MAHSGKDTADTGTDRWLTCLVAGAKISASQDSKTTFWQASVYDYNATGGIIGLVVIFGR